MPPSEKIKKIHAKLLSLNLCIRICYLKFSKTTIGSSIRILGHFSYIGRAESSGFSVFMFLGQLPYRRGALPIVLL